MFTHKIHGNHEGKKVIQDSTILYKVIADISEEEANTYQFMKFTTNKIQSCFDQLDVLLMVLHNVDKSNIEKI